MRDMSDTNQNSGMEAYEHFLGEYACESTPHWTMLAVGRSGGDFAFTMCGGAARGDLVPSESSLTGTVLGSPIRLSCEEGSDRYILSGEAQPTTPGARPVSVALTLVKHVAPPNEALEHQFGVRAETLVRHVRESEQWIHQVRSLHLRAEFTWTRTPEGIAHHRKELEAQFPDKDFTREEEKSYGLCPSEKGVEEIHIDDQRFRHSCSDDRQESVEVWDGQTHTTHIKYLTHNQESYSIAPSLDDKGAVLLTRFSWPRMAQRHKFWWMGNASDEMDEGDRFGRAEEFLLVGKQDYRGVPCYVLECLPGRGDVNRWFVGVEDGLLRGKHTYQAELRSEFWMDQYRQVQPGWWFPMRQGYISLEHEAPRPFVSGQCDVTVTQIELDEDFPDTLFQLEFKEGVRVVDLRFEGLVTYKFRKDMTEQDWERIRAQGRKRAQEDAEDKGRLDARIGREAPAFPSECQWLNTAPLTWRDLRGKAVILQFWSCGCGPCRNHIALLRRPAEGSDIVLIGVHMPDNQIDKVKELMAKYKADGPVCVDVPADRGWGLFTGEFGVRAVPSWFVVGPDGKVVGYAMDPGSAFQLARDSIQKPS
jgi:thiol-disulfide isomerase/thioredoxin